MDLWNPADVVGGSHTDRNPATHFLLTNDGGKDTLVGLLLLNVKAAMDKNPDLKAYFARGDFKGLNGYYTSGVIEGAYHYGIFQWYLISIWKRTLSSASACNASGSRLSKARRMW